MYYCYYYSYYYYYHYYYCYDYYYYCYYYYYFYLLLGPLLPLWGYSAGLTHLVGFPSRSPLRWLLSYHVAWEGPLGPIVRGTNRSFD